MQSFNWQTVDRDSPFTRLDFRTKLTMMIVVTLIAFTWESPLAGGFLTLIVALACLWAGVKWSYILTILKFMAPFYLFLLITMGFFNVEQVKALTGKTELTPLLTVGSTKMTVEGTLYGLNVIFKTLTMVLIIPLAIFTTDINQMMVSLTKARIPYKIVFIFSSTLRLFPLLVEESRSIISAQRLRGLAIEKMGWLQKGKIYASIAVPLILNAMAKSQKLEVVLQAKAFSGDPNRTFLQESILTNKDYLLIIGFLFLLVLAIILYVKFGVGKFAWLF
ncbi:MAG: energy-coupling factor transporter transmembrane protein EcfT [Microcystis viridis Mv_BB_P_19951000_S69]|uniref:Energy-coupling factor transporter transmembrane protein EcfT n=1 Tax=Microcystis viridis Mv_BB_P_19951000_S68D TaxID=2486270 RepID=A0A552HJD2_MICVR|nr:MAG: energy-coupling factor transporter transmembrane protein EcfT [Microcystis viridis Mv_BB_P_19951000_S68D]TRU73255.1 MAG: energy-coupling factor transporter transmembrane protein EcfT [Microcystis viridis Mv_BB_P_19951000_S68]TRU74333.1 MAG: energy-coupling factor transporter transmembrane protein EcfT [Microcystis viridis Mv_BB_P_19951000_S69]TRU84115.1 MAG: energy-coupling factor transporter transmembrane protein EcfT [Microcystis viridis Mv_BB_P_19951000_S69D]